MSIFLNLTYGGGNNMDKFLQTMIGIWIKEKLKITKEKQEEHAQNQKKRKRES